ncbi:MAG: hypothetical protein RIC55_12650 [Pirellulaceae bacterium]
MSDRMEHFGIGEMRLRESADMLPSLGEPEPQSPPPRDEMPVEKPVPKPTREALQRYLHVLRLVATGRNYIVEDVTRAMRALGKTPDDFAADRRAYAAGMPTPEALELYAHAVRMAASGQRCDGVAQIIDDAGATLEQFQADVESYHLGESTDDG